MFTLSKRLKFFTGHLFVSLVIACISLCLVFWVWYPSPLAKAVGVTHIFLMLLAIDVILGPVLGLLVYKEGKKTLKMDLTIIILIQMLALGYGTYSIFQGRPAWIAYNVDRFELVRNNEIWDKDLDQAKAQYQHPSWFGANYVMVEFAKDSKTRSEDLFEEALGGISLAQKPQRYSDFSHASTAISQRAQNLTLLDQFNDPATVRAVLAKYPQATGFLPLKASDLDMTVLVDKKSGSVIKIVDLRPW